MQEGGVAGLGLVGHWAHPDLQAHSPQHSVAGGLLLAAAPAAGPLCLVWGLGGLQPSHVQFRQALCESPDIQSDGMPFCGASSAAP